MSTSRTATVPDAVQLADIGTLRKARAACLRAALRSPAEERGELILAAALLDCDLLEPTYGSGPSG